MEVGGGGRSRKYMGPGLGSAEDLSGPHWVSLVQISCAYSTK